MSAEFETWFEDKYPLTPGGTRPGYQLASVMDLMGAAWGGGRLAERECCAELVEQLTARSRVVRGVINSAPPKPCEYAAEIRKGGRYVGGAL